MSGSALVVLGLAYLYRPSWILTLNKFARERVFSDSRVLLERRKKGLMLLLFSILCFYWSYHRAQYSPTRVMDHFVSTDRMIYQAHYHFRAKQYNDVEKVCLKIAARQPGNAENLYLLAAARYIQGKKPGAEEIWARAEALQAQTPGAQELRGLCLRFKVPTTSS